MKTYAIHIVVFFMLLVGCNTQVKKDQLPEVISEIPADYDPEARLVALGIELPEAGTPVANYVNAVQAGNLIFLAGKGPNLPSGLDIPQKQRTVIGTREN